MTLNTKDLQHYKELLSNIQGKVLRRRSDLKEEISKLEKCHFTVNNKLPAED